MFSLSEDQMDQMFIKDREKFVDFATDRIMEESAANVGRLPRDIVREMTENGLTRAESWGLRSAKTRLAFITIMWEIGPNFDQEPRIAAALGANPADPDAAFSRMLDTVPEAAWTKAEEDRDSDHWYPELLSDKDA